jgi:signal transduction histidine kinase
VSALAFVAVIDLIYDQLDKTIEIPFSVVFANGVAFVIFAMLFYLLIRFMMRTADRVVDVRLYSTSLVNRVSRIIIKGGDIKNSLHKVAQTIIASSRTQFASFYIDHDDSWSKISSGKAVLSLHQSQLDAIKQAINNNSTPVIVTEEIPNDADLYQLLYSKNIAAVVRLGFETEQRHRHTIGYILIGHNEPMLFSDKEIKALSTIGNLVAVSINNAELFQEIQTFNDELTEKVNDATAKLRHTNAQLKKLDAAKDDFISMASHQLRTPLTTVRGYLSMLMDGDFGRLDAAQRKAISNAYVGSERMAFLISDLLDVSRLQAGHFELSKTWFNLAEVVEAEIDQLRELARTHNIHLEATFAPDLPPIYGDRDKLRQVMMNLIDNAIYYSPDGGNVEVSLYARSGHVVFVVRDYGIGVPKDEQMKLFTKFFRASNARRVRPDGTGIGLYVARKVVVAHHGAIIFDSHENQGSTFGFRLPITPDEPTAANSSPNRPPPGQ